MSKYLEIKNAILLQMKQNDVMDEYIGNFLLPYMKKYRFEYDDSKLLIHEFFVMKEKMRSVKLDDSECNDRNFSPGTGSTK